MPQTSRATTRSRRRCAAVSSARTRARTVRGSRAHQPPHHEVVSVQRDVVHTTAYRRPDTKAKQFPISRRASSGRIGGRATANCAPDDTIVSREAAPHQAPHPVPKQRERDRHAAVTEHMTGGFYQDLLPEVEVAAEQRVRHDRGAADGQ